MHQVNGGINSVIWSPWMRISHSRNTDSLSRSKSRNVTPETECIPVTGNLVTFLPALITGGTCPLPGDLHPPSLTAVFLAPLFNELMQKFYNKRPRTIQYWRHLWDLLPVLTVRYGTPQIVFETGRECRLFTGAQHLVDHFRQGVQNVFTYELSTWKYSDIEWLPDGSPSA
jgi:hypothetical protein